MTNILRNSEGGSLVSVEFFKNAAVIIGIAYSIYQGSAFIAGQISEVENLKVQLGRVETHVEKIEDKLGAMTTSSIKLERSVEDIARIDAILKEMERTVLQLEFKTREK